MDTSATFSTATVNPAAGDCPVSLDGRRLAIIGASGVFFWLLGVASVRALTALGAFDFGGIHAAVFLLSLPVGASFPRLVVRWAGLRGSQIMAGTLLAAAIAMALDGIALTWAGQAIYGASGAALLPAASWLLWAVAPSLVAAVAMARR